MLIAPTFLSKWFGVVPSGVLHVGANYAEEFGLYRAAGFGPTIWVEAQSALKPAIERVIRGTEDELYIGCVWSESGQEKFLHVASNSASTSIFEFGDHLNAYPEIQTVRKEAVYTIRLDEPIPANKTFELVTLDIQGAELEALKGLGHRLDSVKWVYSEVSKRQLYAEAPLLNEVDSFLASKGFYRIATSWKSAGWGDALYARSGQRFRFRARNHVGRIVLWIRDLLGLPKSWTRLRRKVYRAVDRMRGRL